MRFLRRSIMGAIASAVATWTWQNRSMLTKSGRSRKGTSANARTNAAPVGATTSDHRGTDSRVPADTGAPSV